MILRSDSALVRVLSALPMWLINIQSARIGCDCVTFVHVGFTLTAYIKRARNLRLGLSPWDANYWH
jgi:hypothetical protein